MIALLIGAVFVSFMLGFATAAILAARRHMAELMEVATQAGEQGFRVGVQAGRSFERDDPSGAPRPFSGP